MKAKVLKILAALCVAVLLFCCTAVELTPAVVVVMAITTGYLILFAKANGFWMK